MRAIRRPVSNGITLDEIKFAGCSPKSNSRTSSKSDQIHAVSKDYLEQLRMPSINGIICFEKKTHDFQTFTVADGLNTNEMNQLSHFRDSTGQLYFGSTKGVISFHPDSITQINKTPLFLRWRGRPLLFRNEGLELLAKIKKEICASEVLYFTHLFRAYVKEPGSSSRSYDYHLSNRVPGKTNLPKKPVLYRKSLFYAEKACFMPNSIGLAPITLPLL